MTALSDHAGWSCRRVEHFDDSTRTLLERPASVSEAAGVRTPELMNYFLECPSAIFAAYLLINRGTVLGWFLLSCVNHQTRIVDIWAHSADPKDWSSAYSLAARTAAADPECCEITAGASVDLGRRAIAANGFLHRGTAPILLYDPQHLLDGLAIHLGMIDSDAAFLAFPQEPYIS